MASSKSDDYATAMANFKKSAANIKPPESNPVMWNLNNGLWHLAQAIQRDMEKMKTHLDAIDSSIRRMK